MCVWPVRGGGGGGGGGSSAVKRTANTISIVFEEKYVKLP